MDNLFSFVKLKLLLLSERYFGDPDILNTHSYYFDLKSMVQDQDVALKKLQKPRLQPTFIYGCIWDVN